ncbi:MAG: OmpA family protein [Blastocatellia bacterium]|nr:OmpA family protein [Blastocatellia bacterium]
MKENKRINLGLAVLVGLLISVPAIAQTQAPTKTQPATTQGPKYASGKKQKISGIIVKREGETIILRDRGRTEITVNLTGTTKIQEKKGNPFRSAKQYDMSALVRGLYVEVEGRGNDQGVLVADRLRFTDEQYIESASLDSRVDPVENRVGDAETRLTQSEQNQQRLSGQLDELAAVANTARGGAKAAQETADKAIAEIATTNQKLDQTNTRLSGVDERVSSLDNYTEKNKITVNFKVNSANLSDEAKAALDELATQAQNEKGFVLQVTGFASSDGSQNFNRALSEKRVNSVIRYLVDNHDIPLRRIITPYGYGELKPVGDNTTHEGREQNRRVEISVLVSQGLTGGKTE